MDTDQIVAFVIPWGLVSKDISPHEVAHDKVFCTCGYPRQQLPWRNDRERIGPMADLAKKRGTLDQSNELRCVIMYRGMPSWQAAKQPCRNHSR